MLSETSPLRGCVAVGQCSVWMSRMCVLCGREREINILVQIIPLHAICTLSNDCKCTESCYTTILHLHVVIPVHESW